MKIFFAFVSCCLFCVSIPAAAHTWAPGGLQLLHDTQGQVRAVISSVGVIAATPEGRWVWRDYLPNHPKNHWWYERLYDGRIVTGAIDGLWGTTDGGCSWYPYGGVTLQDRRRTSLAARHGQPWFLVTGDAESAQPNVIMRSDDGGMGWHEVGRSKGRYLETLASAGQVIVLHQRLDTSMQLLIGQAASGWQFQSVPVVLDAWRDVQFLTALPEHQQLLAVGVPLSPPEPVVSSEGGAVQPAMSPDDPMYREANALLLIDTVQGTVTSLAYSEPGIAFDGAASDAQLGVLIHDSGDRLFHLEDMALVLVAKETPSHCIATIDKDEPEWLVCGQKPQNHMFYSSNDGVTWQGMLAFDAVEVETCDLEDATAIPGGQSKAIVVRPMQPRLPGGPGGCQSLPAEATWGALLVVSWLYKQRQRF